MTLSIPERGLAEVLSAWSGRGQLWEALAALHGDVFTEQKWSARDVERRARRILMAVLVPLLKRWPTTLQTWIEHLPAEGVRQRFTSLAPLAGTSWVDSRVRGGWPPTEFRGRTKSREASTLLVTALRWVLEQLKVTHEDATSVDPTVSSSVRRQVQTALELLDVDPVASASPVAPDDVDLRAVALEGRPWNLLAPVAREMRRFEGASLLHLARAFVMPVEDLAPRLFHLGVLGELLVALRRRGVLVQSLRPLGFGSGGPHYRIVDTSGLDWDLWCEAAGIWSYYGVPSPYRQAASGVAGADRALGCDIMLIRPHDRALLMECKYSASATYVARTGYEQALAYAAEARTGLVRNAFTLVVGPKEIVTEVGFADTSVGRVGIVAPTDVEQAADALMSI